MAQIIYAQRRKFKFQLDLTVALCMRFSWIKLYKRNVVLKTVQVSNSPIYAQVKFKGKTVV
jgi:hypothetical protein